MKVLFVIPARYASSRFPGKPLVKILDKTMIEWVYWQASKADFSELVIATDDQRIFEYCMGKSMNVMMTSEEHASGTSRCAEVAQKYPEMDWIVNIQGDEPAINPRDLSKLINHMTNDCEILSMCCPISLESADDPNCVKVVMTRDNRAMYFSRSTIPYPRIIEHSEGNYHQHIGIYAFRSDVLSKISKMNDCPMAKIESLEQLTWLYHGLDITMITVSQSAPGIDTPADLEKLIKGIEKGEIKLD